MYAKYNFILKAHVHDLQYYSKETSGVLLLPSNPCITLFRRMRIARNQRASEQAVRRITIQGPICLSYIRAGMWNRWRCALQDLTLGDQLSGLTA